jgi:hypothetical protein
MTSLLWFVLGCWVGCTAGVLLFALTHIVGDGDQVNGMALEPAFRPEQKRISRDERLLARPLKKSAVRATKTRRRIPALHAQ